MTHQIELTVGVEELLPPDFEITVICKSIYKDMSSGDYHCEIKGLDDAEWLTLKTMDTFTTSGIEILIKTIQPAKDGQAGKVTVYCN